MDVSERVTGSNDQRGARDAPLVKLCGMCRPADAAAAARAGANYIGVILSAGFARSQSVASAAAIYDASPLTRRAGVFVDEAEQTVVDAAVVLGLDVVQLHGRETPEYVASIIARTGATVWKTIRAQDGATMVAEADRWHDVACALLLDGWSAESVGGTGTRADWSAAARVRRAMRPGATLVLAGGLNSANVAAAIQAVAPDIVDVSSGVEEAKGVKSFQLMQEFVDAVKSNG